MSHALVGYFIVLVSTYALESESGKRDISFILPLILWLALLCAWQFQEDANWGGEVHCVTHVPSSSTSNQSRIKTSTC